jgi:hypothetical protein
MSSGTLGTVWLDYYVYACATMKANKTCTKHPLIYAVIWTTCSKCSWTCSHLIACVANEAGCKRRPVARNFDTPNNPSLAPVDLSALSRARRGGIGVPHVVAARGMVTPITELIGGATGTSSMKVTTYARIIQKAWSGSLWRICAIANVRAT